MSRIFILAASKTELDPLAKLMGVSRWSSNSHAGPISAGPNQLEFFISGIGPKQAREHAADILSPTAPSPNSGDRQKEKPDIAIVIGLCGGLTESLPETTIVNYSSCVNAVNGGKSSPCAADLSAKVTELLNGQNVPCQSVTGITSSRIAIRKEEKLQLARTGAQVVDMESYEILSAAHKAGVPAAVVRVVSDSLDRRLPDLNPALNADGSINKGKALLIMLGSPILTVRAIAANNRAARHLAKALSAVLSSDFPFLR